MKKLVVIGAGTMGTGIAQVAAAAEWEVLVVDKNRGALDKSSGKLVSVMDMLTSKGKINEEEARDILQRISFSTTFHNCEDSDLVIEAVVEDLEIKKTIFGELETRFSEDTIIASNTSSLSLAAIGSVFEYPERFLGIHFFNPAPVMSLVEIVPSVQTSTEVLEITEKWITSWGKKTVTAMDTPGFIVNRVARPFYSEALRIYEERIGGLPSGEAGFHTIDTAMKEIGGFRMGPFELMDFIGNDVNYAVTESVFKAFYYDSRYKPSFTQKRMNEAGLLGRKSGKGFYNYKSDYKKPKTPKNDELSHKIFKRILTMLINEAADTLYFNIASRDDIDLAMTSGVNYPKGLLRWADEIGIDSIVKTMDELYGIYHEERYRCSPLLRTMSEKGTIFYN